MEENKNLKDKILKISVGIVGVLLAILIGFSIWASNAYMPNDEAVATFSSESSVEIDVQGKFIVMTPKDTTPTKGFIFYQGAKVEPVSYVPLCKKIAEQGYQVVIPQMPFNLAILSSNKTKEITDYYSNVESWVIGGHSLGGVVATKHALENPKIKGIAYYASYPNGDELKDTDLEVLSIYGSEDGVLKFDSLEKSKEYLPESAEFIEIKGGNHAQFGDYGKQKGDNDATIGEQEQQEEAVNYTIKLLEKID